MIKIRRFQPHLYFACPYAGPNLTCLQARTCLEIWNPCLRMWQSVLEEVAIGTKQTLLNFTLGNTEYSEKYNLQKFEDSRSFVVIYSEYSQLTLAIIFADDWQPCCVCSATPGKMPKIAGKFVISVHVFCDFSTVTGDIQPFPPSGYAPVWYAPWNSVKCLKRIRFTLLDIITLAHWSHCSWNFGSTSLAVIEKNSTHCFSYKHD